MSRTASDRGVDELLLAEGLGRLTAGGADADAVQAFAELARAGEDRDVVRVNPVRFAEERGLAVGAVVDVFLHARALGLVAMEWQYVCPGCGDVVERLASLTSATAHFWCQVCSAERDADLSDFIAVTFSLSPALRPSPYHDPWSLEPREHFLGYRFTQNGVVGDGTPVARLPRSLRRRVPPTSSPARRGRSRVDAEPRLLWLTNGPALIVGADRTTSSARSPSSTPGRAARASARRSPPVRSRSLHERDRRAVPVDDHEPARSLRPDAAPFLSGAEVLSNQTFLDLFADETIVAGEGLAVQRLTLLFTDLKGSTALYDRIGDLRAFDLVRQHFGHLRNVSRATRARWSRPSATR